MCTVLIISQVHPEYPLVVAANRDELYARPAKPAEVICRDPVAVGGLDLEAGGTWMAVSADGVLVALTNHRPTISSDPGGPPGEPRAPPSLVGETPAPPGLRSRGEIVMTAIAKRTPDRIRQYIERIDPAAYNPFNLVFGDAGGLTAAYVRNDPPSIEMERVPPGVHVLPSDQLDCAELPRVARARELTLPHTAEPWPVLRRKLAAALSDHDAAQPLDAVCIHTEIYGTRSATLVALVPGGVACYEFADGPLCRAEPADCRALFDP